MTFKPNIVAAIGKTPIVRLNSVTKDIACEVGVKLEFMNPGGSIKDRIGARLLEAAEKSGQLKPGGVIVEPTSGNTGVGLAQAAALKGYRCIFVMPDKMSLEKINLLRAYGAEVVVTPTNVEKDSPESYYSVSDRLAREIPNAFKPDQYSNMVNPETHYLTTGPEIWEQTEGNIDYFIAGMGTGGTISGCAKYLKEKNPKIEIVGIDAVGSLYTSDTVASYKIEGIGEDFIPETINLDIIDHMVTVTDKDAFVMTRKLAQEEGILSGGSCGAAVYGGLEFLKDKPADKRAVIILPDGGRSYISKVYNNDYLKENDCWDPSLEQEALVKS